MFLGLSLHLKEDLVIFSRFCTAKPCDTDRSMLIYAKIYRVAHNKIPHQTICDISTNGGLILKILEAT